MKKTYSLLLAVFASVAMFASPAFAMDAPAKCPTCGRANDLNPYPVKVVNPTGLPRTFTKSTVNLALTLDEKGVPVEVRPVGRVDKDVAKRLVTAVSQWRFSPKYVNGVAVPGEFELPIVLTAVEGA